MRSGVIAQKVGMTRVFTDAGVHVPVTVLRLANCQVVAHRTKDKNGYVALQLGSGTRKVKNVTKVNLYGTQAEKIFVEFSNSKLATLGITTDQIFQSLAKQNAVVPAGTVFLPSHYGELGRDQAANALVPQVHDPVSKQPVQKLAAVRVERVGDGDAWWRHG